MIKSLLPFLSLFLLAGCYGPEPKPLEFVDTIVLVPDFVNFNAVLLKGQILHQTATTQGQCGFIWSYNREEVDTLHPGVQRISLDIATIESDGRFQSTLSNLERNSTIYIRTFSKTTDAEAGERLVYSLKTETFTVGAIVANAKSALIDNDTATIFGQLQGIVQPVAQYGHVISSTEQTPYVGCTDCLTSYLGTSNDDQPFQSTFMGLQFNTTYRYRAYAIAYGDTFYAAQVDTFRVRDGWERVADFGYTYAEGAVEVIDGKAYAGFGCKKAFECTKGDLGFDFWQFDGTAQNGLGEWSKTQMFPDTFLEQYNNASFVLKGNYYALFGEVYFGANQNFLKKLYRYTPASMEWRQFSIPDSVFPLGRTGAVAFTLGDYAYVGTGYSIVNLQSTVVYNDFWQYNPSTNHWRKVANIPLQLNPLAPVSTTQGRYDASVFTINGFAYVGCGQDGGQGLRDFWQFHPPINDQDPGEWTQIEFMPPEAQSRYQAVAMTINGKGYIGTGYNGALGYLNDWWEYNPGSGWKARTPFPSLPRANAMGFALGDFGYLGTGHTTELSNGVLYERGLKDFWRYVPENNH